MSSMQPERVPGGEGSTRDLWRGSMVALVTPFADGQVDWEALQRLVGQQIEAGTTAIVVAGTTAESPTLQAQEHVQILREVVQQVEGKMAVIAGTGSYSTDQTLRRTEEAIRDGVDAVMVVAPYYNRPGPRGLREHFLAVAESSPVPVLLYNIPARTGVEMETELLKELADHPRIQALKDATGAPNHAMDVLADSQLAVLCGDDALTLPWLALGATGVVSVAANAVPEEMAALVAEAQLLDWESARKRHYRLLPLFRALTAETNPIPIKALLEILGLCNSEVRLPLVKADEATRLSLRRALGKLRENPQTVAAGAA